MTSTFRRLAAVGEIFALLVAGFLAVRLIAPLYPAGWVGGEWPSADASALPLALSDGLTIATRFSVLIIIGFTWLALRFRVSPAAAGASTGGQSASHLALVSCAVAALAALPWKAIVLWNMHAHAGEGLHAWDQINEAGLRPDIVILVLATAMLLPPLFEEAFVRGYMRTRLQLAFGPASAVIVAALVFALSHGHFQSPDPVVQMLAGASFFAALVFGWATYRTGSIIPAIIGHAVLNAPEPNDATAMSIFVGVLAILALCATPTLLREIARLFSTLRNEAWLHLFWSLPLVAALLLFGSSQPPLLIGAAALGLLLTVADAVFMRGKKNGG